MGGAVLPYRSARVLAWGAAGVALAAGAISVRHGLTATGLDFRSAVWAPGRALLHGHDPYRPGVVDAQGSGNSPFPPYGPPHLVLAALLALAPVRTAGALWEVTCVVLLAMYCAWAAKLVTRSVTLPMAGIILGVLLVSRSGYSAVVLGQPTLWYVPLCWIAWSGPEDSWATAFALAFVYGKPPFAIPIVVALVARRSWRLLARGTAVAAVVSVPVGIALLRAEGSAGALWKSVTSNVRLFNTIAPRVPTRVDLASVVSRSTGSANGAVTVAAALVILMAMAVAVVSGLRAPGSPPGASVTLTVMVAALLCVAHQDYDLVLLVVPLAATWAQSRRAFLVAVPIIATVVLHTPIGGPGMSYGAFTAATSVALLLALAVLVVKRPEFVTVPTERGAEALPRGRPRVAPEHWTPPRARQDSNLRPED